MQKAHLHLIKFVLAKGLTVSVWDGEEWQVSDCTKYAKIKEAIDSVEESQLRIKENGKEVGWALILDQGVADETVSDYTCTPLMNDWDAIYTHTTGV